MPTFEPTIDTTRAISSVENFQGSLNNLAAVLEEEIDEAVENVAEEAMAAIVTSIKESDIDEETGEFIESWDVKRVSTGKWRVDSDARTREGEYSLSELLEFGSRENYTISGDPVLVFEARPGTFDNYPDAAKWDYTNETIAIGEVTHPGVPEYKYFRNVIDEDKEYWEERLNDEIEDAIQRAKDKVGLE